MLCVIGGFDRPFHWIQTVRKRKTNPVSLYRQNYRPDFRRKDSCEYVVQQKWVFPREARIEQFIYL